MASKIKSFDMPLYNVTVTISFDRDLLERKTGFSVPAYNDGFVFVWSNNRGIPGVGIYFMPSNYRASLLTHECVHAAWRVLDIVGITVDSGNHEALAYLAGHISKLANNMFDESWLKE